MSVKQFQKGDVIFHQGDEGNVFYKIVEGSVGIFVNYDGKEDMKLSEVPKGEFFGEMAVIDSAPRSASAVVLEDGTQVQEISADALNTFFREDPESIGQLMKTLSRRLRALTNEYDKAKEAAASLGMGAEKQDEESMRAFRRYSYFHKIHAVQKPSAEVMRTEERNHSEGYSKNVESYSKGTIICKEGDVVPCMYDIHWGRVGIYTDYGMPEQVELTVLAANNFFGEMGMIDDAPRSATAVALDNNTTVEVIYPEDFAELFEKNPFKVDMIMKHLSSRLRKLTAQYYDVCEEITAKTGSV